MERYSIMRGPFECDRRRCRVGVGVGVEPGVAGEQVGLGLAAHDDAGDAVAHGDDGRPRHVVVVARERPAVRAGGRHGEQVAGRDVGGRYSASTTMSPDSQCLPATRTSAGGASDTRDGDARASSRRRRAPVRALSLMPPSTET